AAFNTEIQNKLGVSISTSQIIKNLKPVEIASDLKQILEDLNSFAKAPTLRIPTKSAMHSNLKPAAVPN
ncbi:MAG TPA: hypothetical protein VLX67_08875, partial [Stellaceae bacterium]|nr:hypothetical protein [Stellaceae bacterium]